MPTITPAPLDADAGENQTVVVGTRVQLHGTNAADPTGTFTSQWTQTEGPSVVLENADTADAAFTPVELGAYVFQFTISDGTNSDTDTITITVLGGDVTTMQYSLGFRIRGQGRVEPGPGAYDAGTVLNLTAIPDGGWGFDHWEMDLTGTANPIELMMNANKVIVVVFAENNQVGKPIFDRPFVYYFMTTMDISITCTTPGADIHYTFDDTEPTTQSALYTGTIKLRSSVTLKARAFKEGMKPSEVTVGYYYGMYVPGS